MLTSLQAITVLWLAAWPTLGVGPAAFGTAVARGGALGAASAALDNPWSLLELSDDELAWVIETDPAILGSLSIGGPGSGMLMNAVALPPDPRWEIAPRAASWGTAETIAAIRTAVDTVHELFPDTPPIHVGDISDPDGGRLKRHESHQVGRDVDFGFYFTSGTGVWYTPGRKDNLDLARNWALLRALVVRTDVEVIFLDIRIQRLLYAHALSIGEDKNWLDCVFQFSRGHRNAVVRHLRGHRTHYHVRFHNAVAQELGRRAHPLMVRLNVIAPPVYTVRHVVRPGQTLGQLAVRYGTSVRAIRQANGLTGTRLRAGRSYRIPVRGVAPPSEPIVVPPRLLPPTTPQLLATIDWPAH